MRPRPITVTLIGLLLGSPHWVRQVACLETPGSAGRQEEEHAAAATNRPHATLLAASQRKHVAQQEDCSGRLAGDMSSGKGCTTWRPDVTRRPGGVLARPDVRIGAKEEHKGKVFKYESSEGGSKHGWRDKKGGGTWTWLGAVSFICFIGSIPVFSALASSRLTITQLLESMLLYIWLFGGLYLFTEVLIFQSPHFQHPRTLSVEETAYLYAQILTTVGYGDITPARPRGQLCVGLFVLCAVLLIASMVQEMLEFFQVMMDKTLTDLSDTDDEDGSGICDTARSAFERNVTLKKAFEPVIYSSGIFCSFVCAGTAFFTLYPGEDKTLAQAVYMSFVTLSTVGFGAFTPSTHAGMVVGAYWMLFGCASLMAVITSRAAFSLALKEHEVKYLFERRNSALMRKLSKRVSLTPSLQSEMRKAMLK